MDQDLRIEITQVYINDERNVLAPAYISFDFTHIAILHYVILLLSCYIYSLFISILTTLIICLVFALNVIVMFVSFISYYTFIQIFIEYI